MRDEDRPAADAAIAWAMAHEGGYVDDPVDPGGATNWGISLRFLRGLGPDVGDIDGDGDVDADDIRALTRAQAADLYRGQFWQRLGLFELPGVTATKILDLSINMGPRPATLCLQRALRAAGRPVSEDGILGPVTAAAAWSSIGMVLLAATCSEAAGYYRGLIQADAARERYRRGWLARAYAHPPI